MPARASHPICDPTTFVTIGEGLAAGAGDFGLSEELQAFSFPALVARQLGIDFPQPLMQPPGIGPIIAFPDLPVRLPQPMQTTVLKEFPPTRPYSNLSIPGLKVIDALARRPMSPIVHRSEGLQTAINLILGLPALVGGGTEPLQTQLEYALSRRPTLALISLGYFEAIDAALKGDPAWLPDQVSFRINYGQLIRPLRSANATVIVATIPDPNDTASLSTLTAASHVLRAEPAALMLLFGLNDNDRLTPTGLVDAGCRLIARDRGPLPKGAVVTGTAAAKIAARVEVLNLQIRALAVEHDAVVFDLHALLRRVKRDGVSAGSRPLTAGYLGGFYSLNGAYAGATGHGVIANGIIEVLNRELGATCAPVDLASIAAADPVADYRQAEGPMLTLAKATAMVTATPPSAAMIPEPSPSVDPLAASNPDGGQAPTRLTLPPNLEQALPLNSRASYFGDALRATYARDERDVRFGSAPNAYFGGPCLTQSHLRGVIRITFTPPSDDITHFEVTHGTGLTGEDSVLAAPQFLRLPALMNSVSDAPDLVSSGDLNLATGEVSNLSYAVTFMSSALAALAKVNPSLPAAHVRFPGAYGSAWAKFEPRADGLLDFTFSGVTAVPLGSGLGGDPLRLPLPFAGPSMQWASIPAPGSALHPHLHISTKAPEGAASGECPDIPVNTIREYTVFAHNTAFGDTYDLNIPELGGGATSRAHLLGRVLIQFGERAGGSVPIAVSTLAPGGMLAAPPDSPLAAFCSGRVSHSLLGHDEVVHFPQAAYSMRGAAFADDPFELSIGSVDLTTGRVIGDLLYRGFIVQDVIVALLKLEPRAPRSSVLFRGPAGFARDAHGQTVFGFSGRARLALPAGYGFPQPDLTSVYVVGTEATVHPFFYLEASDGLAPPPAGKAGSARDVTASNAELFSYSYAIPGCPAGKAASFEYVNQTTGGTFRMVRLSWVSFMHASSLGRDGEPDVVTFTGVGFWSHDRPTQHLAAVQISTAPEWPYVSILIDGGRVSNVNTKPATAMPPFAGPAGLPA